MTRSPPAPLRAVIFTDVNGPVSAAMVSETVRFARRDGRLDIVAIVVSDPAAFEVGRRRRVLRLVRRLAASVFDGGVPLSTVVEQTLDLASVERRLRIPVLAPETGDPNDLGFVRQLHLALRPQVALSFYCQRIFRSPLLESFEQCMNYHDSVLPAHRGVLATSFSLYAGDRLTGFTYHRMNDTIDGGPILLQGAIRVGDGEHVLSVKQRKLAAALRALPDALRMVVDCDPGRAQARGGEYHSRRAAAALLDVERPEDVDSRELAHRLRAFGFVQLTAGGVTLPTTRVRPSRAGRPLAFTTADGAVLEPDRLDGLPVPLYRLGRLVDRPAAGPGRVGSSAVDASAAD